jgi:hypothetical protein
METMLIRKLSFVCVVACLGAMALADEEPEALGATDLGIYGSAWMPWLREHDGRVEFIVYQAGPKRPSATIAQDLQFAQATALKVILTPKLPDTDPAASMQLREQAAVDAVARVLDSITGVPVAAVTIGEENVFWDDQSTVLTRAYDALKEEYPERRFYQWYSPTKSLAVPGAKWPDLRTDGWIFDQYFLDENLYSQYVDGLVAKQTQLVSVVWASPFWRPGEQQPEPGPEWWEQDGWRRLYEHVKINRDRDVPTAFFVFELQASGKRLPLFKSDDACARGFVEYFLNQTMQFLRSNRHIPAAPDRRPEWIPAACGNP